VLPLVVAAVLERGERLCEILYVAALLTLATRHADLHDVTALVQAELAPEGHIATTFHRDYLQSKFQGERLLKLYQLLAHSVVRHPCAAVATVRNVFSFETVVDLTLRYPQLFLAFLKIKEAWSTPIFRL
jgi:hypothetical protein